MDVKDKTLEIVEESNAHCGELDIEDIDRIYEIDEDHSKCRDLEALSLESINRIRKFIDLRKIESCEYSITTLFMWKKMYKPHLYFNENYMIIFEHYEGECYTLMPMCQPEYFAESFAKTVELFEEMGEVFEMYCVDEAYAKVIEEEFGDRFDVEADRSLADYLYDGESLRTLKGKKLRKKKNHINAFLRDYEGRFAFELLTSKDKAEVMEFLKEWCAKHGELTSHLEEEITGICYLLDHLDILGSKIGAIRIDGKLEAVTLGSVINDGTEAIIHVEKANSDIRGLYAFINQTFLQEVFPEVSIVNREDDLGIEGLRKAKMSYEPLRLEDKYTITPKEV